MQSRLLPDRLAAVEAWFRPGPPPETGRATLDEILTYLGDRSAALTEFQREFRARRKAE